MIISELVIDCLMLKFSKNIITFIDGKFSIIISYIPSERKTLMK